ncbi:7596_t:CDS:2, partial [Racocetra fulgida]
TSRICKRVDGKFEVQEYDTGGGNKEAVQEQQSPHGVRASLVYEHLVKFYQKLGAAFMDVKFKYEPHDKEYARIGILATMVHMRTAIDRLDRFIEKGESPTEKGEILMSRL